MAEDHAADEYFAGLDRLTVALVEAVNGIGILTERENVTYDPPWQRGRPIPDSIRAAISPAGAPCVLAYFSQAEIEDCWERIDRPDVLGKIRAVVGEYQRLRAAR